MLVTISGVNGHTVMSWYQTLSLTVNDHYKISNLKVMLESTDIVYLANPLIVIDILTKQNNKSTSNLWI